MGDTLTCSIVLPYTFWVNSTSNSNKSGGFYAGPETTDSAAGETITTNSDYNVVYSKQNITLTSKTYGSLNLGNDLTSSTITVTFNNNTVITRRDTPIKGCIYCPIINSISVENIIYNSNINISNNKFVEGELSFYIDNVNCSISYLDQTNKTGVNVEITQSENGQFSSSTGSYTSGTISLSNVDNKSTSTNISNLSINCAQSLNQNFTDLSTGGNVSFILQFTITSTPTTYSSTSATNDISA